MPLARIVSPALLDARGIPADAWFPVLSSGDIPTPAHYLWVDIDARPSLIWSGHLRLEGDPDPQVRMRNRVRAACRRAAVLRETAHEAVILGRDLCALHRRLPADIGHNGHLPR